MHLGHAAGVAKALKPAHRLPSTAGELLDAVLFGRLQLPATVLDRLAEEAYGHPQTTEWTEGPLVKKRKLQVPETVAKDLEELACAQGTTAAELMRRLVALGTYVARAQTADGALLIIREGSSERELVWL